MQELLPLATSIAERLKARGETIAIAESSTGGLISAVLLAVPGASAYFIGGAVVYTRQARRALLDIPGSAFRRAGRWPRPAPPGPPATAMATPPAIAASRSPERPSAP